jgi:predicted Zn-dependent protease
MNPNDINRKGGYGVGLIFLLLIMLILPVASADSEYSYPKTLDNPWDHSPITVYIDNKNLPPRYNPDYYIQIEKALNYWEEGGNGKLNYTPVFKIVDSENADIRITWVDNLEKNESAPAGVGGYTTPQIENMRFIHVDMVLGVGDYKGTDWIQYNDETVLVLAKHELGHALGLEHSSDKNDIMYPDYKQQYNLSSFLEDNSPFMIAGYLIFAALVFLTVSWLLDTRK